MRKLLALLTLLGLSVVVGCDTPRGEKAKAKMEDAAHDLKAGADKMGEAAEEAAAAGEEKAAHAAHEAAATGREAAHEAADAVKKGAEDLEEETR